MRSKPPLSPHRGSSPEASDGEAVIADKPQLPDFTPSQGRAEESWNDSENEAESGTAPVIAIEEEEKSINRGRGRKVKKAVAAKDSTKPARKSKRAATANANYCKLKIRTQGGYKGKGGAQRGGARFGRRR